MQQLPPASEMYAALVRRDAAYEGVFVVGVKTTGITCRPTCSARKPLELNVVFFARVADALAAGYRPCRRCKPLEPLGAPPSWLQGLIAAVEAEPERRWRDQDLRAFGLEPVRVRRWFQREHGMTFHAYSRARRLGTAVGRLERGEGVVDAGQASGWESDSAFRDAFAHVFGEAPGRARDATRVTLTRLTSPLGPMVAAATDAGLCLLEFADRRMLETQFKRLRTRLGAVFVPGRNEHTRSIEGELAEYFDGSRQDFETPLVQSGTPFQLAAWTALAAVPYGETSTYARQAERLGRSGAQRAVGKANGDNPLAIIVPCHRIVRSDGALSGYGGGLWRKRWLLDHERDVLAEADAGKPRLRNAAAPS